MAKTAFNYTVFRNRQDAGNPSFDPVRRFVLTGGGERYLQLPHYFQSGVPIDAGTLRPVHRLRAGTDGSGAFVGALMLFDSLMMVVAIPGAWPRQEAVVLEHEFDASGRTNRVVQ